MPFIFALYIPYIYSTFISAKEANTARFLVIYIAPAIINLTTLNK